MQLKRLKPIDQSSDYMEDLCKKNDTTVSSCGYITCALIQHLTELQHFNGQPSLTQINQHTLTPYIQKVMNHLKKTRRLQIKKFYNQMNPSQRANYIKDWVANFQINDYLDYIKDKMLTQQVYFFRQCAYDHEEEMKDVKFEEAERIKEEVGFKGERLFYTRYFPQRVNVSKDRFIDELRNTCDLSKPVFIATDVLGHFNVTVLFDGIVYVVDSLSTLATNFDQYIVEFMQTCYRKALQGKDC